MNQLERIEACINAVEQLKEAWEDYMKKEKEMVGSYNATGAYVMSPYELLQDFLPRIKDDIVRNVFKINGLQEKILGYEDY